MSANINENLPTSKVCSKCAASKPLSDYFLKDSKKGKLHAQCKACYKDLRRGFYAEHYAKYSDLYRKRAQLRREKLRQEYREKMLQYLQKSKCEICDENDIRVLEFDHIDPSIKSFSISQSVKLGRSWDAVMQEIKKCRVLCANCHKKHTASQSNWYKNLA